jgi:putative DNA primase/helicase
MDNPAYPQNDIGIGRLFFDMHGGVIRYVAEAKSWYAYDGRRWDKDEGGFRTMEYCKSFTQAFYEYISHTYPNEKPLLKWACKLPARRNRESILSDARSIAPVSISEFDKDPMLLNLKNGTLNLRCAALQPHNPADMSSKLAPVRYDSEAKCERWERFIDEVMCGDAGLALYLQKAAGYALTGLTEYEVFFILYGEKTRNGTTTLMETVANLLGGHARHGAAERGKARHRAGAGERFGVEHRSH